MLGMMGILSSVGSFLKFRWKAMLVIVVGLLLVFVIWQWRSDIQDRVRAMMGQEQLMQAIQEQKETIQEMKEERERILRINKKYANQLEEIKESMRGIQNDVRELEQENKEVANWADNRVPDAVLSRLRDSSKENNNKNQTKAPTTPEGMDGANKGAETSGEPE